MSHVENKNFHTCPNTYLFMELNLFMYLQVNNVFLLLSVRLP